MDIRETILNIRDSHNLSQQTFAEKIDVSRTTVARWESGKSIPSSAQIMKICQTFDLDSNELFGITNNKQPTKSDEQGVTVTPDMPENHKEPSRPNKKLPIIYILFGVLIFIAALGLSVTIYYAVKDAAYDSSTTVWTMTIPQNTPIIVLSFVLSIFIGLLITLLVYIVRSNKK